MTLRFQRLLQCRLTFFHRSRASKRLNNQDVLDDTPFNFHHFEDFIFQFKNISTFYKSEQTKFETFHITNINTKTAPIVF
jgi:hypothetical protein